MTALQPPVTTERSEFARLFVIAPFAALSTASVVNFIFVRVTSTRPTRPRVCP